MQLPTEASHEFHSEMIAELEALEASTEVPAGNALNSRLHPKVSAKIRDLVSRGETRLYPIRKYLRSVNSVVVDSHSHYPMTACSPVQVSGCWS